MRIKALLLLSLVVFCTCTKKNPSTVVEEFAGQEIVMPDELIYIISGNPHELDFSDADFKILTYLDSTGCTRCKMKLPLWSEFLDELQGATDCDINFLMLIDSKEYEEVIANVMKSDFVHPIGIDTLSHFKRRNKFPDRDDFQTVLLDSEDRILLLGNPVKNPKIRELYKKIVEDGAAGYKYGKDSLYCSHLAYGYGSAIHGDTINHSFSILNRRNETIEVQEVVPSCDCIDATLSNRIINPGEMLEVNLLLVVDSTKGSLKRAIDIYFKEIATPIKFTLYGLAN